jgi:hypothetical protein
VGVATPPFEAATILNFRVGYLVESSISLEDYREDLEQAVLGSALAGALQCLPGSSIFLQGGNTTLVPMNTSLSDGLCFPEVDILNDCLVLETTFSVVLAREVDPEVARFRGYVEMQQDMDEGLFLENFSPEIDRIQYVSPLVLLPPLTNPEDPSEPTATIDVSNDFLSVRPFTVSLVLFACKYMYKQPLQSH